MRGLARDAALVPLSRDHHFALRHALWMRRAAADQGADPHDRARAVARDFLGFYRDELVGHIADEEDVVFPVGEGIDAEGTARLRAEHREIADLAARLAVAAEGGDASGGADLRTTLAELASLLDDHVRYEERVYFMNVQERLSPEALRALGEALERHRSERPLRCS